MSSLKKTEPSPMRICCWLAENQKLWCPECFEPTGSDRDEPRWVALTVEDRGVTTRVRVLSLPYADHWERVALAGLSQIGLGETEDAAGTKAEACRALLEMVDRSRAWHRALDNADQAMH